MFKRLIFLLTVIPLAIVLFISILVLYIPFMVGLGIIWVATGVFYNNYWELFIVLIADLFIAYYEYLLKSE